MESQDRVKVTLSGWQSSSSPLIIRVTNITFPESLHEFFTGCTFVCCQVRRNVIMRGHVQISTTFLRLPCAGAVRPRKVRRSDATPRPRVGVASSSPSSTTGLRHYSPPSYCYCCEDGRHPCMLHPVQLQLWKRMLLSFRGVLGRHRGRQAPL